jgi:protein-S-isoprenylcysteine O-methyltransferase Ste14
MDYVLLAILWIAFYSVQLIGTRSKIKRNLKVKSRNAYNWFLWGRLLFSFLLLLSVIWVSITIAGEDILPKSTLSNYFAYLFAALGTILGTKSIKTLSLKKMIGIPRVEQSQELIQHDLYARIRHPFYTGCLMLFIGYFLFSGSISSGVHLIAFLIALPMLILLEEKNLNEQFGSIYIEYQSTVFPIIPKFGRS